jgi:hypothetical protein
MRKPSPFEARLNSKFLTNTGLHHLENYSKQGNHIALGYIAGPAYMHSAQKKYLISPVAKLIHHRHLALKV